MPYAGPHYEKDSCTINPNPLGVSYAATGADVTPRFASTHWESRFGSGASLPPHMVDKGFTTAGEQTRIQDLYGQNKMKCIGGNKVHYPCGLGARFMFNDTFALTFYDPKTQSTRMEPISSTAEDIAFQYDYRYKYRNLDPEEKFDKDMSTYRSGGDKFDKMAFHEVLNMWLIKTLPPTVCEDDPLRLMTPLPHSASYPASAACYNYNKFSYNPGKNKAYCAYSGTIPNMALINNGGDGLAPTRGVTCANQIPNPAGWGVENSHFMVWDRPAGLNYFKKKYGNIKREHKKWQKGEVKTLWIANRYNLKTVAGEDTLTRKRVWFQTRSWAGGRAYAFYVPIFFMLVAAGCWIFFFVVLIVHLKNPRRLAQIDFLDWKDF